MSRKSEIVEVTGKGAAANVEIANEDGDTDELSVEIANKDGDKDQLSEKSGEMDLSRDKEQTLRNKRHELYELRAAEIEELHKAFDEICNLLTGYSDEANKISEVWKFTEIFNEKWKTFVDVHERYYDLLTENYERDYACSVYEEQKRLKLKFDEISREWRIKQNMAKVDMRDFLGSRSGKSSKSGKSDRSSASSRISRQSRKKEKMALAQLKLEQIKKRQKLEMEEQEIRLKRELMEAEMEAEKAVLSFQIVSELEDGISHTTKADEVPAKMKELLNLDKTQTDSVEDSKVRKIDDKLGTEYRCNSLPISDKQHPTPKPAEHLYTERAMGQQFSQEIVEVLKQVVNSPKIEYLRFSGDPLKYVTFMHNVEICLERDNPDPDRKLQLLIQHCTGKAREAIESCINLENGYEAAKATLKVNFGKPHIIAEAHIRKLVSLPDLRTADGPSLLEFARNLTTAERTLTGMGAEYTADLNHMTTLRELVKKLPMFLRAKWTDRAGGIIESGHRPSFRDLVKFVQERAKLVDNEFGIDMAKGYNNVRNTRDVKMKESKRDNEHQAYLTGEHGRQQDAGRRLFPKGQRCVTCSGPHGVWRCDAFKKMDYEGKRKCVRENGLCNKCLDRGHVAKNCPKTRFKCLVEGCNEEHHTLMHRANRPAKEGDGDKKPKNDVSPEGNQTGVGEKDVGEDKKDSVSATTAEVGGSKVCLGVVPVKVSAVNGRESVETYALMDNGSEVTLCHEKLAKKLGLLGDRINYTLTGMTGSSEIEGQMVNILVKSMDEAFAIEIPRVKTVKQMPISPSCVAKQDDLERWPHLRGLEIPELENAEVMLLIGVKERPDLFVPLDVKTGGDGDPIAIKYSLGWTAIGPMGRQEENLRYSVNLTKLAKQAVTHASNGRYGPMNCEAGWQDRGRGIEQPYRNDDRMLSEQLERLWKTDFGDMTVDTKVEASVEDRKALDKIEKSLQIKHGRYQAALPWRNDPPDLPNNKQMAERRLRSLENRLKRDSKLLEKYTATMEDYILKGYAKEIPKDESTPVDRPVWYLPHHPVMHPNKPEKVRVVFDCAAEYQGTSLNKQLLQGPDLANPLVGVLIRFREEPVALVAGVYVPSDRSRSQGSRCPEVPVVGER